MRKLMHDHKGAVTVFITLLLIPALLVSGTAVDIARIYSVSGIVKNANQMAANSALAYYDALLKDVYGLFAIAQEDEELGAMLDDYIQATVFDEAEGSGSFTFFRGKKVFTTSQIYPDDSNLANPAILRQQIEEYMKFRGPVIIVKKVLDRIDQFSKLKNDADAICDKLEIDDNFGDLNELYEEIFNRIRYNDYYLYNGNNSGLEIKTYNFINEQLEKINTALKDMVQAHEDFEETREELEDLDPPSGDDEEDYEDYLEEKEDLEDKLDELEDKFNDCKADIAEAARSIEQRASSASSCLHGGNYYLNYENGCCAESYIDNLGKMLTLAGKIDTAVAGLRGQINDLEAKLGNCSEDLAGDDDKGLKHELQQYEAFFYDGLTASITTLKNSNEPYLNALKEHLDTIAYGRVLHDNTVDHSEGISLDYLKSIPFTVNAGIDEDSKLSSLINISDYRYWNFYMATTEDMLRFCGLDSGATDFYAQLADMYGHDDVADKPKKDEMKKLVNQIGKSVTDQLAGLNLNAEGAAKIPDAMYSILPSVSHNDASSRNLSKFTDTSDFSNAGEDNGAVKSSLKDASNIFSRMGDIIGSIGDKALLLTYDTEMFSCYPTLKRDSEATTLTDVPYSTKMNYMLGSELEYMLIGAQTEIGNQGAVFGLLFLTRFVFNYISSFSVASVKGILIGVQAAFVWTGPFAVVIRELARVGLVMGESLMDVMSLRAGGGVPLLKDNTTWQFANPGALLRQLGEDAANAAIGAAVNAAKQAVLDKIASVKSTWSGVQNSVKDTLNRAEEIDKILAAATGESSGLSDITSELDDAMKGISNEIDNVKNKVEGIEAPKISLGGDNDLPDVDTGKLDGTKKVKLSTSFEFYYEDYLRIYLFLFVNGDLLGKRTADLIALNITNYKEKVNADAGAMEGKTLYDMSTARTFIGVQTNVTMDLIFLSMPYAGRVAGGNPPNTFVLQEVDYRGY